jgi:hypothetical protein
MASSATVDGRDVSADGAKLDTLEGIRTKRIRKAIVTLAAITQDVAVSLSVDTTIFGTTMTGFNWDANSMVQINLDGTPQIEDCGASTFDYLRSATGDTITFHFDVPTGTIIDVMVW